MVGTMNRTPSTIRIPNTLVFEPPPCLTTQHKYTIWITDYSIWKPTYSWPFKIQISPDFRLIPTVSFKTCFVCCHKLNNTHILLIVFIWDMCRSYTTDIPLHKCAPGKNAHLQNKCTFLDDVMSQIELTKLDSEIFFSAKKWKRWNASGAMTTLTTWTKLTSSFTDTSVRKTLKLSSIRKLSIWSEASLINWSNFSIKRIWPWRLLLKWEFSQSSLKLKSSK